MADFSKIKYFKPHEFADPDKMDQLLLEKLDAFRHYIDSPVIITSSTNGVHSPNSQHYAGKAIDIVVPERKGSLIALYFIAERFNFTGLGIYPDWVYNNAVCGGLHLDLRTTPNHQGARWIGINKLDNETGVKKREYLPLSISYLKRHKILK